MSNAYCMVVGIAWCSLRL